MSIPIKDDLKADIYALLDKGYSYSQVASSLGCTKSTVGKYANRRYEEKNEPVPRVIVDPEERAQQLRELKLERDALKEIEHEKGFRSFLTKLIKETTERLPPPPSFKPPKPAKTTAHLRYPLLHLSDFHFEEIVKKEAVLNLNEYNTEIACRRAYRVVHSFLESKRDWEAAGRIKMPELVVALNGDFLSGTLHGLERHSDAENVVEATLMCGRLLALILRDLSANFEKIRVYGTVGNHGRLPDDKKVPTKDPTRSFDYIAYACAATALADHKNIEFHFPKAYGTIYEVGGWRVYQGHGNFIKQQLGIVGYGMRRFVSNLGSNLAAAGAPLSYAVFGHFHQANMSEFAGITTFIGPSLIGTQEYGFLSNGSVNRPAQHCFIFDKDLGHTDTAILYGDGKHCDGTYDLTPSWEH